MSLPAGAPTVLYFLSAQCGSCVYGEQQLAALAPRLPKDVRMISVDVTPEYDSPQTVLDLARAVGAHWPQAYATNALLTRFHVTQLDQVVVLAPNGHVVYNGGLPSDATLLATVREAAG